MTLDPGGLLRGSGKGADAPPPPASAMTLAFRGAASVYLFSGLDDPLDLVEVSGDLSFLEGDSLLTAREFAALLTNTRPRPDVVPQQGSSVASVATLMPSDRPEAAAPEVVNELALLLVDPLGAPKPLPASGDGSSGGSGDGSNFVDDPERE
jgi:hypothetical protein